MSFAISAQSKIVDFLRKMEGTSVARGLAGIAVKGTASFAVNAGQRLQMMPQFAKTESVFRQGLVLGIQGTDPLVARSTGVPNELAGVLCEGAAMGLAMLDVCSKWNKKERWKSFAHGEGANHIYEVYVGLGLALAQLKQPLESRMDDLHPLYRWLLVDGYGFHEGMFSPQQFIFNRELPAKPLLDDNYAYRAFDQGLGRSLWFVFGANPERIARGISEFSSERHCDLWSGVGIAAAHAGGVCLSELSSLKVLAGDYSPWLAQGAAFTAKIREHAGTQALHTEMACQELCGISAFDAAKVTDDLLANLPDDGAVPAYHIWRGRISASFA